MQSELSSSQPSMPSSTNGVAPRPDFSDPRQQQLSVAKTVLLQAVDLLDNYLTSDEQLTISSKYLPGSTIGTHQTP